MFQVFIQHLTFAEKDDFHGEYSRICILYHNSCIFCLDEFGFALIPNPGRAKSVDTKNAKGRDRRHAVHGNRLITWYVFQQCGNKFGDIARIKEITEKTKDCIKVLVNEHYPDAYLASFYKNNSKCNHIGKLLLCG